MRFRTEAQKKSAEKLREVKTYSGNMSVGSHKRLSKAIDLMVQTTKRTWIVDEDTGETMPFQLAFTTLTIHSPERMITGKEAYKNLLAPLLQWLRRSHKCYLYVWKAELQERGQVHYHLLLGSFIPWQVLRTKWNKLQAKHGYLNEYYKDHGHYNAPSTEIKNALEKDDIAGYLCKEIAKSIQNQESIGGKVWDCSDNLKEMAYFETDRCQIDFTLRKLCEDKVMYESYADRSCSIFKVNTLANPGVTPVKALDYLHRLLYNNHLDVIRGKEYEKPPPKKKIDLPVKRPVIDVGIQLNAFSRN